MPRIPRVYRVRSYHRDGTTAHRHYLTPEAAEERRARFEQEDADAVVSVTPSHPVTYPRASGDAATFEIPDTLLATTAWREFAAVLGVNPDAVISITPQDSTLVVRLETDLSRPGKRAPKLWRVELED